MNDPDPLPAGPGRPRPVPDSLLDAAFFVFGGVSAVWLAFLLRQEGFTLGRG
ncbi:hypothetical protein [Cryobacterium roopkundense]|uniref:Uncharacterized protein n=1 Tax=Cryobacterium roopkundense TaxID=1001240 RepID=A0A7W9E3W5_9MICO|nr:hypothetical protein [Cryobacterium roopkundense]MBB5640345.1 hypothetical protein [Cryobacterium roopkundense]